MAFLIYAMAWSHPDSRFDSSGEWSFLLFSHASNRNNRNEALAGSAFPGMFSCYPTPCRGAVSTPNLADNSHSGQDFSDFVNSTLPLQHPSNPRDGTCGIFAALRESPLHSLRNSQRVQDQRGHTFQKKTSREALAEPICLHVAINITENLQVVNSTQIPDRGNLCLGRHGAPIFHFLHSLRQFILARLRVDHHCVQAGVPKKRRQTP